MKFHTFRFNRPITILAMFCMAVAIFSQKVDIEFNTSAIGGYHAPKNALAVWIQNSNHDYVKSIHVYGVDPSYMLKNWRISMGLADTGWFDTSNFDGVTSATRFTHDEKVSLSWDLKDKDGNQVPNGIYDVWIEMNDEDYWWGMSDPNEVYPGKAIAARVTLDKDETATDHSVSSPESCFSNFTLNFPGTISDIKISDKFSLKNSRIQSVFNRGSQLVVITPDLPSGQSGLLYITDFKGKTILKISLSNQQEKIYWNLKTSHGRRVPSGVYLFKIRSIQTSYAQSITLIH